MPQRIKMKGATPAVAKWSIDAKKLLVINPDAQGLLGQP